jgi:very-short-patch-repair endonuclease
MTGPELRLWSRLRKPGLPGLRFRRQTPIGPFIVDFFCPERRLIVEVDGGQHGLAGGVDRDRRRDDWLKARGYTVIRIWNHEVMSNLDGVCETILSAVSAEAGA